MNELVNVVGRLITLVSGAWFGEPAATEADGTRQPPTVGPRADVGNGVRWSDIVADIEAERR